MVVPRSYHIIDLIGLTTVEIDVVVGFAQQFAFNSGIELVSGQSQQIHLIFSRPNSILGYFLYVLPNKVTPLPFLPKLVVIEAFHFNIISIIDEPSSLGSSSCRLLVGPLHFLHLLH